MSEVWKSISRSDGRYEVSSYGRVRSAMSKQGTFAGRMLNPWKSKHRNSIHGYVCVTFYDNRKPKVHYVHRLVAEEFLGLSDSREVNHKNGDGTDNRLDNLEIVSPSENKSHAAKILKRWQGEKHGGSKLSEREVVEIRNRLSAYTRGDYARIAREYGLSAGTIRSIGVMQSWTHL